MPNVVVVGKRFVPVIHVALIETFDPEANPKFQPTQEYKSRVVLINRDSVLTLDPIAAFVADHGFRLLPEDGVAINPTIQFRIESFVPEKDFVPSRPFKTRLGWRDLDGNDQSKLLLAPPEAVLALVMGNTIEGRTAKQPTRRRTVRQRAGAQGNTGRSPA